MDLRDRLNDRIVQVLKLILGAVGVYILAFLLDSALTVLLDSPETFIGGIVRYLPANLLMLIVAWFTRDVKGMGVRRGVGFGAAFRCMVQFFPVIHVAYIGGAWEYGFKVLNDFSAMISLAPDVLFYPLFVAGAFLGIVSVWLLADNLTDRVLSLWPGYTWDEILSITGALLVTFMLIHEPGHVLFALLFGVPVRGIGLMFPVGAYTAFAGPINISLPALWFLLMGGNIMTLTVAYLAKDALYNKFIKDLGIICALSTIMNSQVIPGSSIDGTVLFIAFWKVSPWLGILTAGIQVLFIAFAAKLLNRLLRSEAYGSLPIYHDRSKSKGKSLEEEYEEVWR